jgi:hypothetical protein
VTQYAVEPVPDGCRHMRARYKVQASHKSPFPDKRFTQYECEKKHEIDNTSEEELQKCLGQKMGCWKESTA